MKKTIVFLICIFLAILTSIYAFYQSRQSEVARINNFNYQYEKYLGKDLKATDIVTLINKAVDDNRKIKEKNDPNVSELEIKVKFQDVDKIFEMADLMNAGLEKFCESFEYSTFKVAECTYNDFDKRIAKISIEEISYGNI